LIRRCGSTRSTALARPMKGSITPGKLADFVVLADDPHTADKDKIKDIAIVRTVTGGNTVYGS
jgi:predicted amidohydrolase YtcJ